jgi:hypothetical protein
LSRWKGLFSRSIRIILINIQSPRRTIEKARFTLDFQGGDFEDAPHRSSPRGFFPRALCRSDLPRKRNTENLDMKKWVLAALLGAVAMFMYLSIIWKMF